MILSNEFEEKLKKGIFFIDNFLGNESNSWLELRILVDFCFFIQNFK